MNPSPVSASQGATTTAPPKRRNWFAIALAPAVALAGGLGFWIAAANVEPEVVTETETVSVEKVPSVCHNLILELGGLVDTQSDRLTNFETMIQNLDSASLDQMYELGRKSATLRNEIVDQTHTVEGLISQCNGYL